MRPFKNTKGQVNIPNNTYNYVLIARGQFHKSLEIYINL